MLRIRGILRFTRATQFPSILHAPVTFCLILPSSSKYLRHTCHLNVYNTVPHHLMPILPWSLTHVYYVLNQSHLQCLLSYSLPFAITSGHVPLSCDFHLLYNSYYMYMCIYYMYVCMHVLYVYIHMYLYLTLLISRVLIFYLNSRLISTCILFLLCFFFAYFFFFILSL